MLTTHNIDIQAMFVWLTLPFYNFCGFRSVAVNSVYKLQFFYIYNLYHQSGHSKHSLPVTLATPLKQQWCIIR